MNRYSGNYMLISLYSEITCSEHVMPLALLITSVGLTREVLKTVTYKHARCNTTALLRPLEQWTRTIVCSHVPKTNGTKKLLISWLQKSVNHSYMPTYNRCPSMTINFIPSFFIRFPNTNMHVHMQETSERYDQSRHKVCAALAVCLLANSQ